MSNEVYANNMEVSCKAASGKSICSFPDICFTPPQTPATPPGVPIPYPNTGLASDCTDGSSTVMISGQEVMLKNKSCFKKSSGDEAGCAPKKGLINSKNTGKVYFKAWSMDVKFEGENVVRHFDLTTHNHASDIGNDSIPWLHVDKMDMTLSKVCEKEKNKFKEACKDCIKKRGSAINAAGTSKAMCKNKECREARKCTLLPYAIKCCKEKGKKKRPTPHHLMPNVLFQGSRGVNSSNVDGVKGYTMKSAPCICLQGHSQNEGDHGKVHDETADGLGKAIAKGGFDYEQARDIVCKAHTTAIKDDTGKPACKGECLAAQLDVYFNSRSQTGDANDIKVQQSDGTSAPKVPVTGPGTEE